MGSCVSCPTASTPAIITAKVVFHDGSVAQFAAHATARDALAGGGGEGFVCCSDELRFDAPPRAMAASDALRQGGLYFVLPLSALRRPLSGEDMAALAVKVTAALGSSSAVDDAGGLTPSRGKNARGRDGKRRPTAARVAPLVVAGAGDDDTGRHVDGGYDVEKTLQADRTVGKAWISGGGRIGRRRGGLHRLSAILEGSE
uniref:Uncharacterized protein n=1 Tax=Leersia perrieri TaxID=77586 RepID=A0A0D9XF65_9ORYZ